PGARAEPPRVARATVVWQADRQPGAPDGSAAVTPKRSAVFECRQRTLQTLLHVLRHRLDAPIAREAERSYRIHRGNDTAALLVRSVHHHVARQQQPDVLLCRQRPVRERRVAGAEDDVRPEIDVQLLLERCRDVDLTEYAESFLRELLLRAF